MDEGADVHATDFRGTNMLMNALYSKKRDAIEFFLHQRIDPHALTTVSHSSLFVLLFELKLCRVQSGESALMFACRCIEHGEYAAKELIRQGVNVNQRLAVRMSYSLVFRCV